MRDRVSSSELAAMSARRRGVVLSDDESTPSGRPTRTTESIQPSSLPVLTKLSNDDVQKIKLIDEENRLLKTRITAAISVIGDAAVAIEEFNASGENTEVFLISCLANHGCRL